MWAGGFELDNCAAQFKLKNTIGKLTQAKRSVLGVEEDPLSPVKVS